MSDGARAAPGGLSSANGAVGGVSARLGGVSVGFGGGHSVFSVAGRVVRGSPGRIRLPRGEACFHKRPAGGQARHSYIRGYRGGHVGANWEEVNLRSGVNPFRDRFTSR